MKASFINILGWYGALAILIAFALVSFNTISSNSYIYQILNLTGSVGILINAKRKKDFPAVALNACWIIIALIALIRFF